MDRLHSKTVGIELSLTEQVDWSIFNPDEVIQYLIQKHGDKSPERIILKRNFSVCTMKLEKSIRCKTNQPLSLNIDANVYGQIILRSSNARIMGFIVGLAMSVYQHQKKLLVVAVWFYI